MANFDKTPTYNMKVVVQETGIKPDTLRAWERRYGLPDPGRTEGGHRLYSDYDIALLKWLMDRQDEGMSISRAAELWRQQLADGVDPLATPEPPAAGVDLPDEAKGMIEQARAQWVAACLAYDEPAAQRILSQAFAVFPVELVCFEVLQKGLSSIGDAWYRGEISVQQEHFTSALAVRQMETLIAAMGPATKHGRLLIACPPHEDHTFSALLLTLLLRRRGWDVVYLGANVPEQRMQESIAQIKPHLVILVAQTLQTASTLLDMADLLHEIGVPVAYGGMVFSYVPAVRAHVPGHFLGETLQQAPRAVETLLTGSLTLATKVKRASADSLAACLHYLGRRALVEAHVAETAAAHNLKPDLIRMANQELGNNIIAALRLGDMALLTPNIEWIDGLLSNYEFRLSEQLLIAYLETYHHAVRAHLDPDTSQPIHDWFENLLNN